VRDISFHLRIAVGDRCQLAQVLGTRAETLPPLKTIARSAQALQDCLRALPVLPQVRFRGLSL
jgi:hypothetical protein